MNPHLITNTLLGIIAILLLALVVQNGMQSDRSYSHAQAPSAHPQQPPQQQQRAQQPSQNPTTTEGSAPMSHSMVFAALRGFPEGCDEVEVLAECNSPAAEAVKAEIIQLEQAGMGPREVFDTIIETWGEEVLTQEALRIRNMRVSQ